MVVLPVWRRRGRVWDGGSRLKDTEKGRFWSAGEEEGVALPEGREHSDWQAVLAGVHARGEEKVG